MSRHKSRIVPAATQATTLTGDPVIGASLPFAWTHSREYGSASPTVAFRVRLLGPESPLRVHVGEPRDAVFVVVTAATGRWGVSGWLLCSDAVRPQFKVATGWYEVPRRMLRPMDELESSVEADALFGSTEGSP